MALFGRKEEKKVEKTAAAAAPAQDLRPEIIQYTFPNDNKELVHIVTGHPITHHSKLIVGPTQTVLMYREGEIAGNFEPGRQILETGVLPSLIKGFDKAYKNGDNGVPVDIYFFNMRPTDAIPWGLPNGLPLEDPELGFTLNVKMNGQFQYRIVDSEAFFYSNMRENVESLTQVCKKKVLALIGPEIKKLGREKGIGFNGIYENLIDFTDSLLDKLNERIGIKDGFEIVDLTIDGFDATDDPNYAEYKNAQTMALKGRGQANFRREQGYTYQEEKYLGALNTAAANQGTLGGFMGAGMGLTMGAGIGGAFANQMVNQAQQAAPLNGNPAQQTPAQQAVKCPACGNPIPQGSKFCPSCGNAAPVAPQNKFCMNCGAKLQDGAKFCPECGTKQ